MLPHSEEPRISRNCAENAVERFYGDAVMQGGLMVAGESGVTASPPNARARRPRDASNSQCFNDRGDHLSVVIIFTDSE
jgi:hypothetical protein